MMFFVNVSPLKMMHNVPVNIFSKVPCHCPVNENGLFIGSCVTMKFAVTFSCFVPTLLTIHIGDTYSSLYIFIVNELTLSHPEALL